MERRDFLFELMLDDLRSGEPLLQKSAVLRMRRLDYADYAAFVMRFLKDGTLSAQPPLREAALQILKEKKEAAGRPPDAAELEAFGRKSAEALLADWSAADTRLRLAILSQSARLSASDRGRILDRALADANPIVRLEAENVKSQGGTVAEPLDAQALIEELRATNPPCLIGKPARETTVLVIDDSMTVREILAGHLATQFQVRKATNAAEALEQTAATDFDLIFLDVNLPDRDGLELLAELRERGATGNIVIFTTIDAPHIIQTAFIHGANHYFVKKRLSEMLRENTLLPELRRLFFKA